MLRLNDLTLHQSAVITAMTSTGSVSERLMALGLLPGVKVALTRRAPLGDPITVRLHGYELSLRCADAAGVSVQVCQESDRS